MNRAGENGMQVRIKSELPYACYDAVKMTSDQLKNNLQIISSTNEMHGFRVDLSS